MSKEATKEILLVSSDLKIKDSIDLHYNPETRLLEGKVFLRFNEKQENEFKILTITSFKTWTVECKDSDETFSDKEIHLNNFSESEFLINFVLERLQPITISIGDHTIELIPSLDVKQKIFVIKSKVRGEKQIMSKLQMIPLEQTFVISAVFPMKRDQKSYLGYWYLETLLETPKEVSSILTRYHIQNIVLGEITNLEELFMYHKKESTINKDLKIGDEILILEKPLKNEKGKIIDIDPKDPDKIVIELSQTGLPLPITISRESVQKL